MLHRVASIPRRVAAAAVALAAAVAVSAGPPPGERWSDHAFPGSSNWRSIPRPAATAPYVYPTQTTIEVRMLPYQHGEPAPVAYVMAHLPPGADLWVGDAKMVSEAMKPSYELVSPPLEKGKDYQYHVRVMWVEDGKWVTQAHTFPIRAGDIHCVEVVPVDPKAADRNIAASLAKLPTADKDAAAAQKFCAVQDTIRLGSMGPPVKVSVNGKDVYLCCAGCQAAALKDPAKAIKTAEANKDKPVKGGARSSAACPVARNAPKSSSGRSRFPA
jgi:uncharacterized protein (TIGR03000 family)